MSILIQYGADERFLTEAARFYQLHLARVTSQSKELYRIVTEQGEPLAEVSGKFRHEAACPSDYPAVGDFVLADRATDDDGHAIVHQVLPRKSVFKRAAAGEEGQTQVVASNIDLVFLCMSLNSDYNLSRLERYLSVAWSSRATPVIVLTKADLCNDLPRVLHEIASVAPGTEVLTTSSQDPASWDGLQSYLKEGVTAAFLGSSGVGKSTLINCLLGENRLITSAIREDDKGRHTSTRRELLVLPRGGVVIDTPGMRELGVESTDLTRTFADIDALAAQCRFGDCAHGSEPGCAVRAALESGALDARRLESYHKLKRETKYDGLTSRQIETTKLNAMFDSVGGMKKARDFIKRKARGR